MDNVQNACGSGYTSWDAKKKEHYRKISEAQSGKKHSLESRVRMMVSQRKRWARSRGEDESRIRYEDVYDEFINSEKYRIMALESGKGGKTRMPLKDAIRYAKSNHGVKVEMGSFILSGCDA